MSPGDLVPVFFFYGLSFFALGLAVALEVARATPGRLRSGFGLLAAFGLIHGAHEWMEMFQILGILPLAVQDWRVIRVAVLAISFLALAGFGAALWHSAEGSRRSRLLVPGALLLIWTIGLLILSGLEAMAGQRWAVADVWTRYALAIPASLLAALGLVRLRRALPMPQLGRDSLLAAVAFVAYGVVGQLFTQPSPLPPSTRINDQLFLELTGFPVQLLRAVAALVIAMAVIGVMRWFEIVRRREVAELQQERLQAAEHRQALRGELLNRVVQAQEAERERIARELHDETGQALTAIGLGLRGIATRIGAADSEAASQLAHLERLTQLSLDELQRLIAGLRPSHLDDLGLAAALRWYANELEGHAPLSVQVQVEGAERPLPAVISVGLFRVAQEALTNVVKHASADTAQVRLEYAAEQVRLDIRDDGIGFEVSGADRPSWGLMGMQERVSLMGGEFELQSERGQGTHIRVTAPAPTESEREHVHSAAAGG